MKHKLYYFDGCFGREYTIDGKPIIDENDNISPIARGVLIDFIKRTKESYVMNELFEMLMTLEGEYNDLGQCEECGDWNSEYTLNIELEDEME